MSENLTLKQRNKRKKAIRRRRVLLLLLLVAIVTSICLFTPFFNVKTVEVRGNEEIATDYILDSASITPDINIFKVNKRKVKKSVMTIPEIEKVKVRRVLPSKIRLEVTETPAALYFPYMTGYVLTNIHGRVIDLTDSVEGLNLLQISGIDIENAEICKKISVQDDEKFDIIIHTIQAISRVGLLQEVGACHFDDLSDFHLHLYDGTKVMFGKLSADDTKRLEYQLSVLTKVLVQVNRTEGAYIDLTTPERAVYGVNEPEPVAEPETEESEATNKNETEPDSENRANENEAESTDENGKENKGDNQL